MPGNYWYVDAATGATVASGNTGADWANAISKLDDLLDSTVLGAADNEKVDPGDWVFVRANSSETTPDTYSGATSFTFRGTPGVPVKVVGVVAGTTNTGASVVKGDYSPQSGDQPRIEFTGSNVLTIAGGSVDFSGIHFDMAYRIYHGIIAHTTSWTDCFMELGDYFLALNAGFYTVLNNCTVVFSGTNLNFHQSYHGDFFMNGGSVAVAANSTTYIVFSGQHGKVEFNGVDFSSITTLGAFSGSGDNQKHITVRNCKFDTAKPTIPIASATSKPTGFVKLIGCSSGTSKGNTGSYQEYEYEDSWGYVDHDETIVRTGGATDGANGSHSIMLLPKVNLTMESTYAAVVSPWMRVWVAGGSAITLTVYITNDTADLNEDDIWCEWFTPAADDGSDHDHNYTENTANDNARLVASSTIITDDSSTWVTDNTHKQKFSITVTPGYEGWASARVHFAKVYAASPAIVHVDPLIEVT